MSSNTFRPTAVDHTQRGSCRNRTPRTVTCRRASREFRIVDARTNNRRTGAAVEGYRCSVHPARHADPEQRRRQASVSSAVQPDKVKGTHYHLGFAPLL